MRLKRTTPILRIFDEARAREFYVHFLGFKVDWEHRFEPGLPAGNRGDALGNEGHVGARSLRQQADVYQRCERRGGMMTRPIVLLSLLLVLAACDAVTGAYNTVKESLAQAQGVSDDIEKAAGARAAVSVNWKNGDLELVNVSFSGVPKDVRIADLAEQARASIRKRFTREPRQLVIAFTLERAAER